eukprot:scaffold33924_cov60-Phaeocystis_antarctica.AAC.1
MRPRPTRRRAASAAPPARATAATGRLADGATRPASGPAVCPTGGPRRRSRPRRALPDRWGAAAARRPAGWRGPPRRAACGAARPSPSPTPAGMTPGTGSRASACAATPGGHVHPHHRGLAALQRRRRRRVRLLRWPHADGAEGAQPALPPPQPCAAIARAGEQLVAPPAEAHAVHLAVVPGQLDRKQRRQRTLLAQPRGAAAPRRPAAPASFASPARLTSLASLDPLAFVADIHGDLGHPAARLGEAAVRVVQAPRQQVGRLCAADGDERARGVEGAAHARDRRPGGRGRGRGGGGGGGGVGGWRRLAQRQRRGAPVSRVPQQYGGVMAQGEQPRVAQAGREGQPVDGAAESREHGDGPAVAQPPHARRAVGRGRDERGVVGRYRELGDLALVAAQRVLQQPRFRAPDLDVRVVGAGDEPAPAAVAEAAVDGAYVPHQPAVQPHAARAALAHRVQAAWRREHGGDAQAQLPRLQHVQRRRRLMPARRAPAPQHFGQRQPRGEAGAPCEARRVGRLAAPRRARPARACPAAAATTAGRTGESRRAPARETGVAPYRAAAVDARSVGLAPAGLAHARTSWVATRPSSRCGCRAAHARRPLASALQRLPCTSCLRGTAELEDTSLPRPPAGEGWPQSGGVRGLGATARTIPGVNSRRRLASQVWRQQTDTRQRGLRTGAWLLSSGSGTDLGQHGVREVFALVVVAAALYCGSA